MKKIYLFLAAVMLFTSASLAQNDARRIPLGKKAHSNNVKLSRNTLNRTTTPSFTTAKSAGDTIATFPWSEGFETGTLPAGFTVIDSDNDGYTWDASFLYDTLNSYGHNESHGLIASASYINDIGALTPDNWLILPTFVIQPGTSDLELSWYERGQDASYYAENYSVYITTGDRSVASFSATTPVLSSTTTNDWVKKTVSLANYAGQTINIAFRHHNTTDMYWLDIDDISIATAGAPEVRIAGPSFARTGDTVVFTAIGSSWSSLTWSVNATYTSTIDNNAIAVVWDEAGLYEVVVTAANNAGSSSDTASIDIIACNTIASFPFVENFENGIPCWKMEMADPDNSNEFGITTVDDDAIQGTAMFVFSSYDNADDYNQYLITPELQLPDDGYMVKFYYYAESSSESFRILASSTNDDLASFTNVLADFEATADEEITEVAAQLPANTKYIAINYYGDYQYNLYIDSLTIEPVTAPNVTVSGPESIGTGNEALFVAHSPLAESFAWTVDGTQVSETGNTLSHIFTTVGIHTVSVTGTNSIGTSDPATISVDVFDCGNISLPYTPDFSEGLHCWTNHSNLAEDMGWFASIDAFEEGEAEGQVVSLSAINFFGMFIEDVDVDNWLSSPLIDAPTSGNYDIAWKVKPFTTDYSGDHYGVYVIDNSDNETLLFEETLNATMSDYVQRTTSLPGNLSGSFRIAFRHFNSQGGYAIILDDIKIVTAGTIGIDDVESNAVNVYPNPANDILVVDGEGITSVQILDMSGRAMQSSTGGGRLDISNLANGIYMIRVMTSDGVSAHKIVKR